MGKLFEVEVFWENRQTVKVKAESKEKATEKARYDWTDSVNNGSIIVDNAGEYEIVDVSVGGEIEEVKEEKKEEVKKEKPKTKLLICPNCGGQEFKRTDGDVVTVYEDKDGMKTDDLVVRGGDCYEYYCVNCDRNVTKELEL